MLNFTDENFDAGANVTIDDNCCTHMDEMTKNDTWMYVFADAKLDELKRQDMNTDEQIPYDTCALRNNNNISSRSTISASRHEDTFPNLCNDAQDLKPSTESYDNKTLAEQSPSNLDQVVHTQPSSRPNFVKDCSFDKYSSNIAHNKHRGFGLRPRNEDDLVVFKRHNFDFSQGFREGTPPYSFLLPRQRKPPDKLFLS